MKISNDDIGIILKYTPLSLEHQIRRDRIQLTVAAVSIFMGFIETWPVFRGFALIIPIGGFVLAVLNLLLARFYQQILNKFGDKVDNILMAVNGIAMLVSGIAFQYQGSNAIQYAYYFLAFAYLLLPYTIIPGRLKRLKIIFDQDGVFIKGAFKNGRMIQWTDLFLIELSQECLKLGIQKQKKEKRFCIHQNEMKVLQDLDTWIIKNQSKNKYQFNYVSHL